MANKTNNYNYPDKNGRFGSFGGRYVSETLISALEELESLYKKIKNDKKFQGKTQISYLQDKLEYNIQFDILKS